MPPTARQLPLAGQLEILRQRLVSIPERMGEVLARTAYSANIKERRDHSCALFDAGGELLAQAAHIPVHLGSMGVSVAAARAAFPDTRPGDVYLLNDPYAGGTHLPDLTAITPVHSDAGTLLGFAASRAHHADVGGSSPGSMGAATSVHQEGLRIPPVRWFDAGREQSDVLRLLLANVRGAEQRLGDLRAQFASLETGRRGLVQLRARYAADEFAALVGALWDYAERRMRSAIATIPHGRYEATDYLEGDGQVDADIPIRAALTFADGAVLVSFAGTAPAAAGCVNCPMAVTRAAVTYVFVCLAGADVPHNAGLHRPIAIDAPDGCLVNARYPAAVAAGNVETSQRIVDVVMSALASAVPDRMPAASAGSMNSLTLGASVGPDFAYYETTGGGAGASPSGPGESGVHTHMTNTRNTPIEVLETEYPLRVRRYELSDGSGGRGRFIGGDGIVRELIALVPMHGAILADRHRRGPSGRADGLSGRPGGVAVLRADGARAALGGKSAFELAAGDSIQVATPGGGGWGSVQLA